MPVIDKFSGNKYKTTIKSCGISQNLSKTRLSHISKEKKLNSKINYNKHNIAVQSIKYQGVNKTLFSNGGKKNY